MSKYTDQMFILKQRLEPKIEKRVCVCECVKHIKQVMIMIIFQVHVFSYCFHTKKNASFFILSRKKIIYLLHHLETSYIPAGYLMGKSDQKNPYHSLVVVVNYGTQSKCLNCEM